jgi:hypothetical protein
LGCKGWLWLDKPQEFWSFVKSTHHEVQANVPLLTPRAASYGYTFPPTPPVATEATGVMAAIAEWEHGTNPNSQLKVTLFWVYFGFYNLILVFAKIEVKMAAN